MQAAENISSNLLVMFQSIAARLCFAQGNNGGNLQGSYLSCPISPEMVKFCRK